MNKTVIIYKALSDTVITCANGHTQLVKAGDFIAYNTDNDEQFCISEHEISEYYTFIHNDQYIRKSAI